MRRKDVLTKEVLIAPPQSFWREAISFRESVTPHVFLSVVVFVGLAIVVSVVDRFAVHYELGIEIAPYEISISESVRNCGA
jgi:predicted membrane chloride channel (bestrophin family)